MVTVVVPNYNHASYLNQRIDSILSQTYQNFELIILDDNSTDNSREIIESYRFNPKVSAIIFNESNSGSTFKQWKKGIDLAKGDIIWIAESDDWCEYTFLENLIAPFVHDSSLVISYCSLLNVRNNNIDGLTIPTNFYSQIIDGEEWRHLSLLDKIGISNASAALFRKDAVKFVDFDKIQSYKLIGDRLFWFQLAQQGKVHISAKVLSYCRRHETNVTESKNREGVGFLEYLDFLKNVKDCLCYNDQVELHVYSKIIDSFIYMEDHNIFLNPTVRDNIFKSIESFLPNFKSNYVKKTIKQKLSAVKKRFF